jgi:hypothetical protein
MLAVTSGLKWISDISNILFEEFGTSNYVKWISDVVNAMVFVWHSMAFPSNSDL